MTDLPWDIDDIDEQNNESIVIEDTRDAACFMQGYQQAIQEVLDILKAEGWVGVVYKRIEALKDRK